MKLPTGAAQITATAPAQEPTHKSNFSHAHPSTSNQERALLPPRHGASRSLAARECKAGAESVSKGASKGAAGRKEGGRRSRRRCPFLTAEEALSTEGAGAEPQHRQLLQPGHRLLGAGQQPRQPLQLPAQPGPPAAGQGTAALPLASPSPAPLSSACDPRTRRGPECCGRCIPTRRDTERERPRLCPRLGTGGAGLGGT